MVWTEIQDRKISRNPEWGAPVPNKRGEIGEWSGCDVGVWGNQEIRAVWESETASECLPQMSSTNHKLLHHSRAASAHIFAQILIRDISIRRYISQHPVPWFFLLFCNGSVDCGALTQSLLWCAIYARFINRRSPLGLAWALQRSYLQGL